MGEFINFAKIGRKFIHFVEIGGVYNSLCIIDSPCFDMIQRWTPLQAVKVIISIGLQPQSISPVVDPRFATDGSWWSERCLLVWVQKAWLSLSEFDYACMVVPNNPQFRF